MVVQGTKRVQIKVKHMKNTDKLIGRSTSIYGWAYYCIYLVQCSHTGEFHVLSVSREFSSVVREYKYRGTQRLFVFM